MDKRVKKTPKSVQLALVALAVNGLIVACGGARECWRGYANGCVPQSYR
jgi:hypothetical protein